MKNFYIAALHAAKQKEVRMNSLIKYYVNLEQETPIDAQFLITNLGQAIHNQLFLVGVKRPQDMVDN